jgi:hypothetical protein
MPLGGFYPLLWITRIKLTPTFGGVLPLSSEQQQLHEGMCLLLLVTAAAGEPLGVDVECLLDCYSLLSHLSC